MWCGRWQKPLEYLPSWPRRSPRGAASCGASRYLMHVAAKERAQFSTAFSNGRLYRFIHARETARSLALQRREPPSPTTSRPPPHGEGGGALRGASLMAPAVFWKLYLVA